MSHKERYTPHTYTRLDYVQAQPRDNSDATTQQHTTIFPTNSQHYAAGKGHGAFFSQNSSHNDLPPCSEVAKTPHEKQTNINIHYDSQKKAEPETQKPAEEPGFFAKLLGGFRN